MISKKNTFSFIKNLSKEAKTKNPLILLALLGYDHSFSSDLPSELLSWAEFDIYTLGLGYYGVILLNSCLKENASLLEAVAAKELILCVNKCYDNNRFCNDPDYKDRVEVLAVEYAAELFPGGDYSKL